MFKIYSLFITALLLLAAAAPVTAQDEEPVTPIGVVSLVWGEVTIKHTDADYKAARWLEPVYEGDQLRTNGDGAKLLVVFFSDNHQEVVGTDAVCEVGSTGLKKTQGQGEVRVDPARNPFGAGGVENPFIYTYKLVQDDFKGADEPGALENEQQILKARVRPDFPPSFYWPNTGAKKYKLQIFEPAGKIVWSKELAKNQYKLRVDEANQLLKGVDYKWSVLADGQEIVRPYQFKLLTLPLRKWFDGEAKKFNDKRDSDKLQRSDWTDYLLVCSQVVDIDRAFELTEKMKAMDPENPRIYRVLTRLYIYRSCPAHAKAAHDKLNALGGRDPIYP
ncbi:MAG: hypothetical protein KC800_12045 [Candidatus Eremiobacteraeota bacterium]|nr:hypothetical protein [Candidatus Eremiobacteraeota bacterium]